MTVPLDETSALYEAWEDRNADRYLDARDAHALPGFVIDHDLWAERNVQVLLLKAPCGADARHLITCPCLGCRSPAPHHRPDSRRRSSPDRRSRTLGR